MTSVDQHLIDVPAAWAESAGVETLRRMASVDNYNRWIFQKLAHHVGQRILEVGCGIGNMTPFFLGGEHLTCVDVLAESIAVVRQQYGDRPEVEVRIADIVDPATVGALVDRRFDTVVCLNVLEHIEDDERALAHMFDLLQPGGKLLVFVPAGEYLYGHLDEALGHYRRYALGSLSDLIRAQGFVVDEAHYMNVAGVPGWFLASRVFRREEPPRSLLWLFNILTPLFIWFEETFRPGFGQSIVCVARRPR
ncbi:MAG: class I SAM-dependent methyltransferase [Chloroflexi bacterium]|nr:class I SAM-dependent methyltransferase [Chloroflexota bacterium]